jgi:carbon-monoxide dehydrogenase medium subunit
MASVGITLEFASGEITKAAMVCSGADLFPIRAPEIEDYLVGKPLASPGAAEAGASFAASIDPVDDHIASADYRRSLIAELSRRAIEIACTRALERS